MVTRKGGENGDGCGTLGVGAGGSGHPPESRSRAGQGRVDAGGYTRGGSSALKFQSLPEFGGSQPDTPSLLPLVSACLVVPEGSYDHFQCFLEAFFVEAPMDHAHNTL